MKLIGLLVAIVAALLALQGCGLSIGAYYDAAYSWDNYQNSLTTDNGGSGAGNNANDGGTGWQYPWTPTPGDDTYTPPPYDGGSDSGSGADDNPFDDDNSGTNIPLGLR
jgi:hypothetical protein